ncbi:hypothetical protein ACIBI4_31040 [Streptomyces sp. NPDC050418]|uniref:hypothetical protein n=1 Tax=Streptomyces sp. NPDC050418 TaxID=3365612 RepID=UPI00379CEB34
MTTSFTSTRPAEDRVSSYEAYALTCLDCGHGWEVGFDITPWTDAEGRRHVRYTVDGEEVPSPLSRPTCPRCDGHVLRIMRSGRVATAKHALTTKWQAPLARGGRHTAHLLARATASVVAHRRGARW